MNEIHDFFHQPRAVMLSIFMVILLLWIFVWEDPTKTEGKKNGQASPLLYKNNTYQFNFDSLIRRMDAYYQRMIANQENQELSRKEISDMLFGFHQERRRLYNHLELLKKQKQSKLSSRAERSLRHYLQSIETCIDDLKKKLKQKPETYIQNR